MSEANSYALVSGSKRRSRPLGYKPASARRDDAGSFGGMGSKSRPKGPKVGIGKSLRKLAKKMMKSY